MKALRILLFAFCLPAAWAQFPTAAVLPEIEDDHVLATFDDGAKFTMREFRALYLAMDQRQKQAMMTNRKLWLDQIGLLRKLGQLAEQAKYDQKSPIKEQLEYQRTLILAQAEIDAANNGIVVEGPELVKYYEENRDKYRQVKPKVLYISFIAAKLAEAAPDAAKGLTEEQAKQKAEKLVAQLRAGADFVKLVKENSDDQTSKAKDGDFGILRPTDNIPETIRTAVFKLKQGEVSDPVRQANGFYIFKCEESTYRPLTEVRDEVYTDVKNAHQRDWFEKTRLEAQPKIVDASFFSPQATAPNPAAPVNPSAPLAPKK